MKRTLSLVLAAALAGGLAACGQSGPKTPQDEDPPAAESAIPDTATVKTAQGRGKVTAVDPAAGTVTLAHEAMPELQWPGMTMAFKASPTMLEGIKVGDQVTFDVQVSPAGSEVTRIAKP